MVPFDYYLPIIKNKYPHLPFDPRSFHHDSKKKKWKDKKKHGIVRMENLIRLLFTNYQEKTSKGRIWFRSFFSPFIIFTPSFSSRLEEEEKEKGEIVRMENRNGPIRLLFTNYHEKTSKDRLWLLSSLLLSFPHPPSTFPWFEEEEEEKGEIVQMQNQNGPIRLLFTNYQRKRHRKIDFGFDLSSHPLSFPHSRSTFPSTFPSTFSSWLEEEEEEEEKGGIVRMENRNGFDLSSLPLSSPYPLSTFPSIFVPSWFKEQEENRNDPIRLLFINYQEKTSKDRRRKIDFDLSSLSFLFISTPSIYLSIVIRRTRRKSKLFTNYQ